MRNIIKFVVALLSLSTAAFAGPWILTWNDEFNGAANTSIDGSKWSFDTGGGGYGNNELETYTNRTQNVRQDGAGHLVIEARAETYTGSDGITRNYTSGRFHSNGKFSQAYGRAEALIKIPYGQGIWPAFWMMGNNIGSVGWPSCGEIDIMENVGFEPNVVHGTIHGPGYSGASGIGLGYNDGSALANGYHLYAVEWEPNVIRWYIDNILYEVRSVGDIPGGTTWVYDHPFFILFNLAVGGNWPGNPDGSTVFPQQMLVDYVRVYAKDTAQTPYSAQSIPGTVECEDYDHGGEGVAFHDTTPPNAGGVNAPRADENVDLEACTDAGGGADLGWTVAGEWLEYTVNVAATGPYAFTARVASQGVGGNFHLQMDAVDVPGSGLSVPDTGGWQNWQTVGPVTVNFSAGTHVLQLYMDSNGATGGIGNLNWLHFTSLVTPSATRTQTPVPTFTRTNTILPTATFSGTRTPVPTATSSATPSVTPTRTLSAANTATSTATTSDTRTVTSTRTSTATSSATPSYTPPNTPTVTGTATPSKTADPSPSVSPSITQTATDVPVGSSPTFTPTISGTFSATASFTRTPSRTFSPTATPSATPSSSATPSVSASHSPTLTATPSLTPAAASRTPSGTTTGDLTSTPTFTATLAATPDPSRSPTAIPTTPVPPTATATSTRTPAPLPSSTSTSSPTPSMMVTAIPAGGHGHVQKVVCVPNPSTGPILRLALNLDAPADETELNLYSAAMTCVLHQRVEGPFPGGWSQASLDVSHLAGGLYFLKADRAATRVLILR